MKSHFLHFASAFAVCAAVLIGYGAWYAAIAAKSTAVADLQNKIDTKAETVSRIAAARATLADIASDEAVVQAYFVPETGVVALIDALEARGAARGVVINVLSVSAAGTSKEPALALTLTIQGTFDAVMRTVGSIEYAPYALSVSSLSLGRGAQNNWQADLKILVGSVLSARPTLSPAALAPSSHAYF